MCLDAAASMANASQPPNRELASCGSVMRTKAMPGALATVQSN